ncbi:MAG: DUF1707 domain-containing protein, partial [Propionibacterium sp.]|nr:DUF1707 domain-containing protein [Propionibacterium sp.]
MNLPQPRNPGPVDPRAGDADRDAVAQVLQQAAAQGRLTVEELDERVSAALVARTQGDLTPLIEDLPEGRDLFRAPMVPEAPGYSPDDPLRLAGGWGREVREGPWVMPPWIVIESGMGQVRLDCRQATPAEPVITIQVLSGMGEVLVILPQGWGVNLDRVQGQWGTKTSKVAAVPEPGMPLVRFEGSVGM